MKKYLIIMILIPAGIAFPILVTSFFIPLSSGYTDFGILGLAWLGLGAVCILPFAVLREGVGMITDRVKSKKNRENPPVA